MSCEVNDIISNDVESRLCSRLEVRRSKTSLIQLDKAIRRMRIRLPLVVMRVVRDRLMGWA